jgi:DNA-binding CsgD family transcriptional regulator
MKGHAIAGGGANALAPLVLAIGQPSFPSVLLDTVRTLSGAGHCMVFSFDGEQSARCPLGIGNIGIGPDLGAAYSGHFYTADPNREVILSKRAAREPIVLPSFSRRMYGDTYRKLFFEGAEIVDKIAAAIWVEGTCFYVNFYRTAEQGRYSRDGATQLASLAPTLAAIVARHYQDDVPDTAKKLERLFTSGDCFRKLTARERDVCLRILLGYGSEAISAELGISLHSTLTYRKRAYEKLGISSQNELFGLVLRLMVLPGRSH